MANCKSCGAPIRWVKLAPGMRYHPLDAEPSPTGSIGVFNTVARVLPKLEPDTKLGLPTREDYRKRGAPVFTSHFATCPQASEHRRARG